MEFLKSVKRISLYIIGITLLVGIAFTAFPEQCIEYISLVIGISLIVSGVFGIIRSIILDKRISSLITGIVTIIFGVIICTNYFQILSFIIAICGALLIVFGLFNIFTSIKIISFSGIFGWVTLGLSVLSVVFGIIAFTKSQETTTAVFRFLGIALIVYAILDIISYIEVRKMVKDVKTAVDAATGQEIETSATVVDGGEEFEVNATASDDGTEIETSATIVDENDE